jgi:hypothetical protein
MRDNMFVKFGGHPMPIDLNIEHLIGILKVFDLSKFFKLQIHHSHIWKVSLLF